MKVKLFWMKNPVKFGPLAMQYLGAYDNQIKTSSLEDEINAWLQEHPNIKISNILQSATGGSWGPMLWSISIWYEENDTAS
jgi:hypothetical protein